MCKLHFPGGGAASAQDNPAVEPGGVREYWGIKYADLVTGQTSEARSCENTWANSTSAAGPWMSTWNTSRCKLNGEVLIEI